MAYCFKTNVTYISDNIDLIKVVGPKCSKDWSQETLRLASVCIFYIFSKNTLRNKLDSKSKFCIHD